MKKIRLRALTKKDIEKTIIWHNTSDISDLYAGHPFPVNREMEELWYNKILTSNFPTTVFGIELINEPELIGLVILKNINMINKESEFAIYIGEDKQKGKGYSTEACKQALSFAFLKLGLNRVFLKVIEKNQIAINLYKKCGFVEEGLLRKSVFKNGVFENEIIMSVLIDEFNV